MGSRDDHDRGQDVPLGVEKARPPVAAAVPPGLLVGTGIVSLQLGAGLAARLFSQIPPAALTGLRLWAAAVLLAAWAHRGLATAAAGLVRRRAWRDTAVVTAFGLTLAVMNYSIYQSFARIDLGIAVTVEFLGPLAVAVASSRRAIDVLWVALAAGGVVLLTPAGHASWHGQAVAGLAFALLSALCWAAYILLSRATGRRFTGSAGLAIAMIVAAVAATPAAAAAGGSALLRPEILGAGVVISLLSSIIPYSLELETLRRIPARVFGIWMSVEPAVAAVVGLVLLRQALSLAQWAAIGCVIAACAGAARGAGPPPQPQA